MQTQTLQSICGVLQAGWAANAPMHSNKNRAGASFPQNACKKHNNEPAHDHRRLAAPLLADTFATLPAVQCAIRCADCSPAQGATCHTGIFSIDSTETKVKCSIIFASIDRWSGVSVDAAELSRYRLFMVNCPLIFT
jgi:hypothetical protein